MSIAEKGRTI